MTLPGHVAIVYALADPRDVGAYRYVGKTEQQLDARITSHIYHATNPKRNHYHTTLGAWIRTLLAAGIERPVGIPLEICRAGTDSFAREVRWKRKLRECGHQLLNDNRDPQSAPPVRIEFDGKLSDLRFRGQSVLPGMENHDDP